MKDKNKLDNSRDLQIWIWSNKPAIKESCDFIFGKMKRAELTLDFKANRLKNHLKVILTDLFVAHRHDNTLYISISRNKNDYWNHEYFSKIFLNYRYLIFVIDYLKDNGYIEYHRGIYTQHFQRKARIRATKKLLRLFKKYDKPGGVIIYRRPPIILKDEEKREIDYDYDTFETRTLIRNVNRINKYLSEHKVEHFNFFEDIVTEEMYKNSSKYYRVFNNSSFKNGGRFYGHWSQQIESDQRRLIFIDDKQTVELDYSCLHISMLYGLEGLTPPEGDLYELDNIPSNYRKVIKKAVNIAINANSVRSAMSAIREEIIEFCNETDLPLIRPKILLQSIANKHMPIQKYFFTGFGLHLQFLDSQIAEKIMLTLGEEGICCLCIHDSFIVPFEYADRLRNLMTQYFFDMFNFYPRITMK